MDSRPAAVAAGAVMATAGALFLALAVLASPPMRALSGGQGHPGLWAVSGALFLLSLWQASGLLYVWRGRRDGFLSDGDVGFRCVGAFGRPRWFDDYDVALVGLVIGRDASGDWGLTWGPPEDEQKGVPVAVREIRVWSHRRRRPHRFATALLRPDQVMAFLNALQQRGVPVHVLGGRR